jgi:hypothetical protein
LYELIELFVNNLLPVFVVAGFGFWMAKSFNVSPKSISQISFHLFSPCLAFTLLTQNRIEIGESLGMFAFSLMIILITGLLAYLLGRILRLERRLLAAVMITTMFMNAGNYGMPVVGFAFGETALAYASLFFASMVVLTNTLGIVIASMGSLGIRQALLGALRTPMVYAVGLALIFMETGWRLPLPLERSVTILGNAAIPTMLVILGLQFHAARWGGHLKALLLANGLRMVAAPLVGFAIAPWFKLSGNSLQAGIIEAAMPAAVLNIVLATEFDAEPSFVTFVVFTGTLFSPLTITPLLYLLGA